MVEPGWSRHRNGAMAHASCRVTWIVMSCPAATLTVWASAWLNQRAASDDVLDALQFWAETHDMVAADRQASLDLGLPLDGEYPSPPIQLLAGLRAQGARRAFLVLPVAGDVRGLGGPGPFSTQALRRGEGMVLGDLDIGMVPHSPADGDRKSVV